jgi:DNA-directed RNA polymerase subunit RPC12/RpoP
MIFKDKEIVDGLIALGSDIKELYNIEKEDVNKLLVQAVEVNQKIDFRKAEIDALRIRVDELNTNLLKLTEIMQGMSKPNEPVREKGYCITCKDNVELVCIEPNLLNAPSGAYRVGKCPRCNSKIFNKI